MVKFRNNDGKKRVAMMAIGWDEDEITEIGECNAITNVSG